ncbi:MAG TPA: periplasmic heavy metal sensor [Candidatus Binatia bacterium]|jgi:uncharacterized membrane protein|nr:periplasmic heavy metal sensor [Candidatus Binatia bacterium]
MNKKLKFVFLASILLNVLLGGVLLGELPRRLDRSLSRQEQMDKAIKELSEPMRSRFRNKMEQARKDVEPIRDQIQEARNETIRVFIAEPFDEVAYDRQVSKITDLRVQLAKRMAASMKEAAKELPSEQRQALAEAFKRPPTPSD